MPDFRPAIDGTIRSAFKIGRTNPATLDASALTAARTLAIRDLAGTIALTSDVPAGSAPKGAHVFLTATQSIPNNAATALAFTSEAFDNDGIHDNATNTSRLTCQTAGLYVAIGQVSFATKAGGSSELTIRKNGTADVAKVRERQDDDTGLVSGGDTTEISVLNVTSPVMDLAIGDYLELVTSQTSGGAINASSGQGVTWFSMVSQAATGTTGADGPSNITAATTTNLTGILKGNGATVGTATAGTDYLTPTGNGSGITGLTKSQVGLGNVDNTSDANKPVSTAQAAADAATLATAEAYADSLVVGLYDLKSGIDASSNPNYPSALKGDAHVITVAGKIGGASGTSVDVSDVALAIADNAGGTQAAVGSSWIVLEHNLVGALLAANNLSDLASAATARTNLQLGNSATTNVGSTSGTVAAGDDSRLSDSRTPTAHAASHAAAGSDPLTLSESQITNLASDLAAKASLTGAETLTNKRITPRVQSVTSSATVTPNADADDGVLITAQAAALTLANPSGTPVDQQKLLLRIKDNATARAITYGSQYRAMGTALPTTTTISKWLTIGLIWSATNSKWDCVAAPVEA